MKKLFIITILSLLFSTSWAQNDTVTVKYNKNLAFEVSYEQYSKSIYVSKKDFRKLLPEKTVPLSHNGDKFESIEKLYQIFSEVFTAEKLQQLADIDSQIDIFPYWYPDGRVFEVAFYVKCMKDYSENDQYLSQIPISLSELVKFRDLFIKEIQFQPTSPQLIKTFPYCSTWMTIKIKDIVARTFVWNISY